MEYKLKLFFKTFFVFIFLSNAAVAGTMKGTGSIKNIYIHSKEMVIQPLWKGVLQLEIDSLSWNSESDCSTQYVAVREKDTQIFSAVLAAKMSGSPITVYVNEDLKIAGSFCYVRAVGL